VPFYDVTNLAGDQPGTREEKLINPVMPPMSVHEART
jgi:hypothetical protein